MRISWTEFCEYIKPQCVTCPVAKAPDRKIAECVDFCLLEFIRIKYDEGGED
jgi:hypothetical protein